MASSGNFCVLNPLAQFGTSSDSTRAGSMSSGNLKYVNLGENVIDSKPVHFYISTKLC